MRLIVSEYLEVIEVEWILRVKSSLSQYQLILWYFTANGIQLSSAIEGDVTDGINNIFLTLF